MLRLFDIQRFCLHDGPGIRTTFFTKGCPLRCRWCHNPEGLQRNIQLRCLEEKCISCGKCVKACPLSLHAFQGGRHFIDFESCTLCGSCINACPANALSFCGYDMSPENILQIAKKDYDFYGNSGGVTFSGGEPLTQAESVAECAKLLTAHNIPVCIDTSGAVPWDNIELLLPYVSLFLYDIKAFDSKLHIWGTRTENSKILLNLKELSARGVKIWVRVPVIPCFNEGADEMEAIASFVCEMETVEKVTLIPYHRLGAEKYKQIGMNCNFIPHPLLFESMRRTAELFLKKGMKLD